MRQLKEKLTSGECVYTGWLNSGSIFAAEIMARVGLDCVTVDMQHGLISDENAMNMFQAIAGTGATPIARCSWNEPSSIMRLLDFGAMAIICPMVNTAGEARRFIDACRYPPAGMRSYGPTKPAITYGADYYFHHANDSIVTMAMIETRLALENVEAIVATPYLDGVFIGPSDLGVELCGGPVRDEPNSAVDAAIEEIVAVAARHGKFSGVFCFTPEGTQRRQKQGCTFFSLANESIHLKTSLTNFLATIRSVR